MLGCTDIYWPPYKNHFRLVLRSGEVGATNGDAI